MADEEDAGGMEPPLALHSALLDSDGLHVLKGGWGRAVEPGIAG